jgi:glycosyltransferase involved in cell wall biosynthesis
MKIVLPVHHFLPQYNGGAEQYTLRLARWLQKLGHEVNVVCVEAIDVGGLGEIFAAEDSYNGIPVWRLSFNLIDAPERNRWDYNNALLGDWFAAYFESFQPDVIHFQAGYLIGIAPLRAAVNIGIPTVLTLHDYWFLCPRITLQRGDGSVCTQIPAAPAGCAWCRLLESRRYRVADRLTGGMVGWLAQRSFVQADRDTILERRAALLTALALPDAVIVPSRFLAERVTSFIQPDRLHISRLGLDLHHQSQQPPHPEVDEVFRIGFIGQIAPHKGIHLLIKAFRMLNASCRAIALHIYGDLQAHPSYVGLIRRLASDDKRIHFHGRFENTVVANIIEGCDVIAVPSSWYEIGPLTISEAQAVGTPVVAAAIGNIVDLVRHGVDGLLFAAGDAHDLARQLQRLLDEPNLLPYLRSQVVMPRNMDDEMRQLVEIYQNIGVRALQEVN